jgi:8-oxo-dGTP diphosphatase
MATRFNVRVYGILIKSGCVLVSDELIKGRQVTKFPGGGLEFGEGPADCVIREFYEELGIEATILSHYYTTDFFVASAFDPHSQVISIYYLMDTAEVSEIRVTASPHDHGGQEGAQSCRWIPLKDLRESDMTLIIDAKVAEMLRSDKAFNHSL